MLQQRKFLVASLAATVIIAIVVLVFWLKPNDQTENEAIQSKTNLVSNQNQSTPLTVETPNGAVFESASQKDIQINCQLNMDSSNHLIVNESTKNCFEFFITQYGEKSISQIKNDFLSYAKNSYKEPLFSQLSDLWNRYIQYREALGSLEQPNIEKDKPGYYSAIFNNMKALRKKYFSDYEIEGLFGTEDIYNDYTIDRMAILDNKNLSESEKAQKLKELFNHLPEDWKENLQQLSQLEDLRKLTAELKARGGSAAELHQMRTNLVGAEATQRLETLDGERSQFKSSVNQYLDARDAIVKSNMSDSAKQSAIQQLRNQHFNNPQEQLRLQTFETIHDQGGKLPFAD